MFRYDSAMFRYVPLCSAMIRYDSRTLRDSNLVFSRGNEQKCLNHKTTAVKKIKMFLLCYVCLKQRNFEI